MKGENKMRKKKPRTATEIVTRRKMSATALPDMRFEPDWRPKGSTSVYIDEDRYVDIMRSVPPPMLEQAKTLRSDADRIFTLAVYVREKLFGAMVTPNAQGGASTEAPSVNGLISETLACLTAIESILSDVQDRVEGKDEDPNIARCVR